MNVNNPQRIEFFPDLSLLKILVMDYFKIDNNYRFNQLQFLTMTAKASYYKS